MIPMDMIRRVHGERLEELPGTSLWLNSASTLVCVEGIISSNWARLARCPTMLNCCLTERKLETNKKCCSVQTRGILTWDMMHWSRQIGSAQIHNSGMSSGIP
jgi:hypothetical protein